MAILPKMRGTTIKKENRAALARSIPNNTEVEMVAPDLEIPGIIAMACDRPMINALFGFTDFEVFFALSAKNNKEPVTNSMTPTNST